MTAQEKIDDNDRLARMENSIATVSEQVGALLRITEKNDSDRKAEIRDLWTGMKELGKDTSNALKEQAEAFTAAQGKGEITVGKIIAFCTFLILLVGSGVGINNAYSKRTLEAILSKFEKVDLHRQYAERERKDIRADISREFSRVDHESLTRHGEQQAQIGFNARATEANEARIRAVEITEARENGKNEVRFKWLRDDDEAQKEDLSQHIKETKP